MNDTDAGLGPTTIATDFIRDKAKLGECFILTSDKVEGFRMLKLTAQEFEDLKTANAKFIRYYSEDAETAANSAGLPLSTHCR